MLRSICKINCEDGAKGTGFFCKVPFPDTYNLLPILMTNNHVLNQNQIEISKNINITLNNEQKEYTIKIDNKRKVYTLNKPYDVTFIEIKKDDGLNINIFLEIDNQIFEANPNQIYAQKTIYLIHYPKGEELKYSLGVIKDIKSNNIYHFCHSENGSSGGPLINLNNFKVIGIHKGSNTNNQNIGTLLKVPIVKFINNNYSDNINEKNIITNIIVNNRANMNLINDEIIIEYNISFMSKLIVPFSLSFLLLDVAAPSISPNKIKIFGDNFVKNNKNVCKLFINEEEYELCSYLDKKEIKSNGDTFKIILKGINNSKDLSGMFEDCSSLLSLPDISNWNTSEVTNMSNMFSYCRSLISLPNISHWEISNVTDMNKIFFFCSSLKSLPDISIWNTSNVTDMSEMFSYCLSLKTLPDISNWNTSRVTDMNKMFYYCSSLISLPDISNWNTNSVIDIGDIFNSCSALISLPDISKWNTIKVDNMKGIFDNCCSLTSLPDISKWNTSNVTDMSNIFSNCYKLRYLPDLSKWDTKNVNYMNSMFNNCSNLSFLPDISNWNTSKIKDISYIFNKCSSLIILPDIMKWKLNPEKINCKYMFHKCDKLCYSKLSNELVEFIQKNKKSGLFGLFSN